MNVLLPGVGLQPPSSLVGKAGLGWPGSARTDLRLVAKVFMEQNFVVYSAEIGIPIVCDANGPAR